MSIGGHFAEMAQSGALTAGGDAPCHVRRYCLHPAARPGYLGYVSGAADPARADSRVLTDVGLFILGFAAVLPFYGAAFGDIGGWLVRWQDTPIRVPAIFSAYF